MECRLALCAITFAYPCHLDGLFAHLEECVVPYEIGDDCFKEMIMFGDGIYSPYTRLVQSNKSPVTKEEKSTKGDKREHEKTLNLLFGVLKGKRQYWARQMTHVTLQFDCLLVIATVVSCSCAGNACK